MLVGQWKRVENGCHI